MRFLYSILFIICGCASPVSQVSSQSVNLAKDFRLGSPFSEPDGRSDMVKINATDFVTLAKVKGSQTGKSEFVLERYDANLNVIWSAPLFVEDFEEYKKLYFNGKEIVLLSVIHKEAEKKTKLEGYGFDVRDGKKTWTKELESFDVGDWETHPHKGKVKESFIDLICEHSNQDFITPFEYKHNLNFSPDLSKFVSFVYNYGEPNLTASVSVYDNSGNLLNRGKISIDNDYINYGVYVNNAGLLYILNANNMGKVNLIQYNLSSKDFQLLDLPPSNYMKDDFHVQFLTDNILYVGNTEVKNEKIYGVMFSKFDFSKKQVELSVFEEFNPEFKAKVLAGRKSNKQMRGEEDWMDYDITHFNVNSNEEVLLVIEKRTLHADGSPHVGRSTFDKSHKVEFTGHVQAETIMMFAFDKNTDTKWTNLIYKTQIYPVTDGLNTISFVMDQNHPADLRILYASSENMDGSLRSLKLVSINKESGAVKITSLPNDNKLTLVKDYTFFTEDNSMVIVGKKGLLGKASMIVKYKL